MTLPSLDHLMVGHRRPVSINCRGILGMCRLLRDSQVESSFPLAVSTSMHSVTPCWPGVVMCLVEVQLFPRTFFFWTPTSTFFHFSVRALATFTWKNSLECKVWDVFLFLFKLIHGRVVLCFNAGRCAYFCLSHNQLYVVHKSSYSYPLHFRWTSGFVLPDCHPSVIPFRCLSPRLDVVSMQQYHLIPAQSTKFAFGQISLCI